MDRKDASSFAVLAAVLTSLGLFAAAAEAADLTAKEAGARYGQAVGAAVACRGMHLTKAVEELERKYDGEALKEFQAEAQAIAELWKMAGSCKKIREINSCRFMMERNCVAALAEIGPKGTAYPGLIERADEDDVSKRRP